MISPIEFHLPTVTSTNDYAKTLLATYPYVFVSAMHQTAGRGRKGRVWEGEYGLNAYCSLALRHSSYVVPEDASAFMARGALSVIHVLRSFSEKLRFRIKYPNDVQVQTEQGWRKISGVLVEHEYQGERCMTTIVGIGINVQQDTFSDTISEVGTSLSKLGVRVNVQSVLQNLKSTITDLRMQSWQIVHEEWVRELNIVGKTIELVGEQGVWNVSEVLTDGRLIAKKEHSLTERIISDGDTIRYHD